MLADPSVITDIQNIIYNSRDHAVRLVDHQRTRMYWQIGQRIFEEEQQGKARADYGNFLIVALAENLVPSLEAVFQKGS